MNELELIIAMIMRMIANGEVHQDYNRVCSLDEEYFILTTGKDVGKLLHRFVKRESEEDFKLRCDITQAITPCIAASIKNPFYKVTRNERIKKGLKIKGGDNRLKVINEMMKSFYGNPHDQNSGLDYWLKTQKFNRTFVGPNSWCAIEWEAPQSAADVVKPYPFLISAKQALNFEIRNNIVQWLFCYQDIKIRTSKDPSKPLKDARRYTLYHGKYTVVFEQVDEKYFKEANIPLGSNQYLQKVKSITYIVTQFEPKVGFPAVFRLGYKPDIETEERTFVITWHDALPYFRKTLKTVSELDLTMSGHVFPQKFQYAPPCPGPSKTEPCSSGYLRDDSTCTLCKGTGFLTHTAANDVIYLPMPDVDSERMLDLDKLLVYKAPPIDLVKFQQEYTQHLEAKAHNAVFNSQMFVKKASGGEGNDVAQTAYEIDTNMQSIYDTLEAYTESDSQIYKFIVTVMAIIAGEQLEDVEVTHSFPADFKLKTMDMLLAELKGANDSGAPSFVRDAINYDLAEIIYSGDPVGLLKYRVKRKFFPFNGKTEEQVEFLMSSSEVARREKVLYANFESIFSEIEAETPEFYTMPGGFEAQYQIVEAKVQEWILALDAEKPKVSFDMLKIAAGNATPEEEETAA